MLLTFDFQSAEPLYLQIRNQIVLGIGRGELQPGQRMPTVRTLAAESGVNMMTVSKAYQLLKQEGYLVTDRRGGTTVASPPGQEAVSEQTLASLRLMACELRLAGMTKEQWLNLCQQAFEEGES